MLTIWLREKQEIHASKNSLTKYYLDMMFVNKSCIYGSFINDELRGIISRRRLSNHDLKIELGRYGGIPREGRVCDKYWRMASMLYLYAIGIEKYDNDIRIS